MGQLSPERNTYTLYTKFLPFKTMLDDKYDEQIPEYSRFSPDLLFASLKNMKLKMGLLIDLTNTNRFYNKDEIEKNHDCKYVKLQCRGHGETPASEQVDAFNNLCHHFISQKPLEIIGVHCTHGFNRTGFLISAYLVEKLSWSIEAAVATFAQARPPGIYKQDYLEELFTRYGEKEDTPPAPILPDWCDESDDQDDNGNAINGENSAQGGGFKGRRREFVKKDAKFMEGVKGVSQLRLQPKLAEVQRRCQVMCGWNSSGFPGSQPVSMDIKNLAFVQKKPYKVSWKADGTRYMMLIDGKNEVFMFDRDNTVFHVPNLEFPRRKDPKMSIKDSLLDGEMILDKIDGRTVPRYLVYDIVKFEGNEVGKTSFNTRLHCIEKEIIGPRYAKMAQGQLDKNKEPFSIRAKPFWDVTVCRKILDGHFSKQVSHEVDGLVFQPVPDPYCAGRCMEVLKWKPPDQNSIDFKLKVVKEKREGMLAENKAYLYVLGLEPPMAMMRYTKNIKDLDGKIIECSWDGKDWKFMRQRIDKSHPNSYNTAMGVWQSIQTPVTKDILFSAVEHLPSHLTKSEHKRPPGSDGSDRDLMPPPIKQARRDVT
ncbi:mRNA-capping enzyme-like isoform X2 [Pecten maximus]|uniref:mRNA-capping enzyme-like isoform X2 n=1 Tax=Pecten maximus TaxID=6579 RepID=UPI0014586321|nr:mRNA-capping enzyme-like isoform X2 [Pecten maximus]XP_033726964.1 mRNA-capping enzyme-like isoform X2 [Pecten maximus]